MSPIADPVLVWSLRGALALLLGAAALHKLRDPRDFAQRLADYELLPTGAVAAAARAVPAAEGAIAAGLLTPFLAGPAALAAAGLMLAYGVAMGVNLARGRTDLSCGCFGPAAERPLHPALLGRNAVLAAAALAAAAAPASRPLTPLDAVTGAGAALCFVLLFLAAEGLVAVAATPVREPGS